VSVKSVVHNQSGMALVMTLLIISFLVALTLQVMMSADRQMTVAANSQERVRLDGMVLGGLNLVLAALQADQKENHFDSEQDLWGTFDSEKLQELTEDIQLEISVEDLSGKLSLSTLLGDSDSHYRAIWLRLLTSGRLAIKSQEQAESLLDALIDWIDEDDEENPMGAESGYYQGLESPYSCRNGNMLSEKEILLVRGMTPEIAYGDHSYKGLLAYIDVTGKDVKINLNTASLPVLMALHPDMTAEVAQELIDYRENANNREKLASPDWYNRVPGVPSGIDLSSLELGEQSSSFFARIRASHNNYQRTGLARIVRSEKGLKVVSWQLL